MLVCETPSPFPLPSLYKHLIDDEGDGGDGIEGDKNKDDTDNDGDDHHNSITLSSSSSKNDIKKLQICSLTTARYMSLIKRKRTI